MKVESSQARALTTTREEEDVDDPPKDREHVSTTPTPIRRKPGPASRVKVEPSQARVQTTTREEEDVDDPLSYGISPSKEAKSVKAEVTHELSPLLPPPKI